MRLPPYRTSADFGLGEISLTEQRVMRLRAKLDESKARVSDLQQASATKEVVAQELEAAASNKGVAPAPSVELTAPLPPAPAPAVEQVKQAQRVAEIQRLALEQETRAPASTLSIALGVGLGVGAVGLVALGVPALIRFVRGTRD